MAYIDSSVRNQGATLTETWVNDCMLIIGLMTQKEAFEGLLRRCFYQHILECTHGDFMLWIVNDQLCPAETALIDQLKVLCGNVFVTRLDSLAKDAITSREFNDYLKQVEIQKSGYF